MKFNANLVIIFNASLMFSTMSQTSQRERNALLYHISPVSARHACFLMCLDWFFFSHTKTEQLPKKRAPCPKKELAQPPLRMTQEERKSECTIYKYYCTFKINRMRTSSNLRCVSFSFTHTHTESTHIKHLGVSLDFHGHKEQSRMTDFD
jgi:hypothetical protein